MEKKKESKNKQTKTNVLDFSKKQESCASGKIEFPARPGSGMHVLACLFVLKLCLKCVVPLL
jgi:hypothetical protein